jgi:hypothetical protein
MKEITKNNTIVVESDTSVRVTLHKTDIVTICYLSGKVTLDTGGYLTHTTICRMNQVLTKYLDHHGLRVSRAGDVFTLLNFGRGIKEASTYITYNFTTGQVIDHD